DRVSVVFSNGFSIVCNFTSVFLFQRLREGVLRDFERQHRKQENLRLLEQQIALTEQLEMERSKMLMGKESSQ
uniref:PET117 cytochrome c oxidase chaperone n=1 Tax=Podarcis muralis TaxID=64176 RepID=A0A670IGL2_PODMU